MMQRAYTDEERAAWPYGKPPEAPMGISNGYRSDAEVRQERRQDEMFSAIIGQFAYVERKIESLEMEIRRLKEGPE